MKISSAVIAIERLSSGQRAIGYNRRMDVERSSRAPRAFRESCLAALYTLLTILSLPACAALVYVLFKADANLRAVVGCCVAAVAIFAIIRRVNRRDDPRRLKPRARAAAGVPPSGGSQAPGAVEARRRSAG